MEIYICIFILTAIFLFTKSVSVISDNHTSREIVFVLFEVRSKEQTGSY